MKKKCFSVLAFVLASVFTIVCVIGAPLYGDLNNDGRIDSTDSVIMNRHILDIRAMDDVSKADLNGDGMVNSTDYVLMKRYILGIISKFPVEDLIPDPNDKDAWKNNTGTIQLGNTITVSGRGISVNGSVVNITAGGDHEVTGTLTNGMIYINTEERVKLRLSGVSITNLNGPAIYFDNVDKGFITITKDTINYLTDGSTYRDEKPKATLHSNDDLEIKGSGTLYIKGNYRHGINSNDDLIIENGNIIIDAVRDGINTNDKVKITGGNIDITAESDGIDCGEYMLIEGGIFKIRSESDGIKASETITIKGGTFDINAGDDGIDSKQDLLIEDGTFTIKAGKDGLKAVTDIKITGGTFDISAVSEGIQSDGPITINGGNFIITAKSGVCAETDITINGGTLNITQPFEGLESRKGQVRINGGRVNITVAGNDFLIEKNQEALTGDIIFSVPNSTFRNQISVSLSTKIAGAEIRYTTDGSVPTRNSPVYNSALSFTRTTQLRAQSFVNGTERGEMGTSIYVASSIDATHDLPVLVLDAYGGGKPPREYRDVAFMLMEPKNNQASILQAPTVATRAGFRLRGQSSAEFEKAPYRIELWDNYNEDAKYPLLGMPEDGDWILLSPYPDKSLIRNALAYELGRAKGLEVPRYRFVEVYINLDSQPISANDYQGVYLLVERIEINSRRLNIAKLDENDNREPDISGGYLMQFNMMVADEPLIRGNGWNDLELTQPKNPTREQLAWITNYIQRTHNAIHSSNPSDPNTGYPAYIDVDSFVDYIIHNELGRQGDSYLRSTRLYKDRGGKLTAGPLWDFDLAYDCFTGMFGMPMPTSIEGWQFQPMMGIGMGGTTCDWFYKLMQDPSFQSKISARWQELRRGPYSDAQLRATVDALASPLSNAARRNFQKWNILSTPTVGNFGTQTTQSWEQQLDILKDFLVRRAAWLDNSGWQPTSVNNPWPGGPGGGWPGGPGGGWPQ
ncbi:UNVERIFIED_CONTAM: dockerin type I repeat protein [Acetivibrio alkalicellulosi]